MYTVSQQSVYYLIFCNLKKLEPMSVIFGMLFWLLKASMICIKPHSYLLCSYSGQRKDQVLRVTATFLNMLSNKEDCILIKIYVSLKHRLHRSCWKNFQVRFGMNEVFGAAKMLNNTV